MNIAIQVIFFSILLLAFSFPARSEVGNDTDGLIEVYPESETKFFDKFGNQWTFMKNDKREVTAVILHGANFPIGGKKFTTPAEIQAAQSLFKVKRKKLSYEK